MDTTMQKDNVVVFMSSCLLLALAGSALIFYNITNKKHSIEYKLINNNKRMYFLHKTAYFLLWFIAMVNFRHVVIHLWRHGHGSMAFLHK